MVDRETFRSQVIFDRRADRTRCRALVHVGATVYNSEALAVLSWLRFATIVLELPNAPPITTETLVLP